MFRVIFPHNRFELTCRELLYIGTVGFRNKGLIVDLRQLAKMYSAAPARLLPRANRMNRITQCLLRPTASKTPYSSGSLTQP